MFKFKGKKKKEEKQVIPNADWARKRTEKSIELRGKTTLLELENYIATEIVEECNRRENCLDFYYARKYPRTYSYQGTQRGKVIRLLDTLPRAKAEDTLAALSCMLEDKGYKTEIETGYFCEDMKKYELNYTYYKIKISWIERNE